MAGANQQSSPLQPTPLPDRRPLNSPQCLKVNQGPTNCRRSSQPETPTNRQRVSVSSASLPSMFVSFMLSNFRLGLKRSPRQIHTTQAGGTEPFGSITTLVEKVETVPAEEWFQVGNGKLPYKGCTDL